MSVLRVIFVLAISILVVITTSCAPYPTDTNNTTTNSPPIISQKPISIEVDHHSVYPGNNVIVSGDGFTPWGQTSYMVKSTVIAFQFEGSRTASSTGALDLELATDTYKPGDYKCVVIDQTSKRTAECQFTVLDINRYGSLTIYMAESEVITGTNLNLTCLNINEQAQIKWNLGKVGSGTVYSGSEFVPVNKPLELTLNGVLSPGDYVFSIEETNTKRKADKYFTAYGPNLQQGQKLLFKQNNANVLNLDPGWEGPYANGDYAAYTCLNMLTVHSYYGIGYYPAYEFVFDYVDSRNYLAVVITPAEDSQSSTVLYKVENGVSKDIGSINSSWKVGVGSRNEIVFISKGKSLSIIGNGTNFGSLDVGVRRGGKIVILKLNQTTTEKAQFEYFWLYSL